MLNSLYEILMPLRAAKNLDKLPVNAVPAPEFLYVHLKQHEGAEAAPVVKAGDEVKAGQTIGWAMDFMSADVHAPMDGKVVDIERQPNPYGGFSSVVVIKTEGKRKSVESTPDPDYLSKTNGELLHRIRRMGVMCEGPAPPSIHSIFNPYMCPSRLVAHVGRDPLPPVDTLIVTAIDEEPIVSINQYMITRQSNDVPEAIKLMKKLSVVTGRTVLACLDTQKKEAEKAASGEAEVRIMSGRYPGTLRELTVWRLTGREIPAGASPMSVGVAVIPLRTAIAALKAVRDGIPQTSMIVTVAGDAVTPPQMVDALIGTPARDILKFCDVPEAPIKKLVFGGPIRGKSQFSFDMPITKGVNTIVALKVDKLVPIAENNCINCGACVEFCPARLQPNMLSRHCQFRVFDEIVKKHITACLECGVCGYICPSRRPMLQYFQNAKQQMKLPRKGNML